MLSCRLRIVECSVAFNPESSRDRMCGLAEKAKPQDQTGVGDGGREGGAIARNGLFMLGVFLGLLYFSLVPRSGD